MTNNPFKDLDVYPAHWLEAFETLKQEDKDTGLTVDEFEERVWQLLEDADTLIRMLMLTRRSK